MAHLGDVTRDAHSNMSRERALKSPFYSRTYGGYTLQQEQFYLSQLETVRGKIILDPMAGQGFLLPNLSYQGAHVWLGDINPALGLLASLRSAEVISRHEKLALWAADEIRKIDLPPWSGRMQYVDGWIDPITKNELIAYRTAFGLNINPFDLKKGWWRLSLQKRFAMALPLLAARNIACFRSSDNHTWIKAGGLQREANIREPILRALDLWTAYARDRLTSIAGRRDRGSLIVETMDAASGDYGSAPRVDAIVTSPPYANRLDYTRMWGPESQVLAAMWDTDVTQIQARQIGSNVVRGIDIGVKEKTELPPSVIEALAAIKGDASSYASAGYYYPFFLNYAASLTQTVQKLIRHTKRRGKLVFFVRDTVRKDVLFPTGALVEEVMNRHGFDTVAKERKIIKVHVGLRRLGSASGLYGIGQQEWWLAFQGRP